MIVKPFSNLPSYNTDNIITVSAVDTLFGDKLLFIGTRDECKEFVKEKSKNYNRLIIEN